MARNMRTNLIYSSTKPLPPYFVRDGVWLVFLSGFLVIELILLGIWTAVSKPTITEKYLPGHVIEYEFKYGASSGSAMGAVLWVYNIIILLIMIWITYQSHTVAQVHSEFTMLLILSASLTISSILLPLLRQSSSTETDYFIQEAILVFINTSIPLLLQAVPRCLALLQNEVMNKQSVTRWYSGQMESF
ncbi:hypothetical protein BDR26DRAFT_474943 [Obelidium mucronatum]|nr:hypothetical protein BDR26DRAFT_474943 [Obelidium mucronatum]